MSDKLELSEQELKAIEDSLNPLVLQAMEKTLDELEQEHKQAQAQAQAAEDLADILARAIRSANKGEKLARLSKLKLQPPKGMTRQQVEQLLAHKAQYAALAGVIALAGKKDTYYYDSNLWTDRFAQVQVLLEDKDILATIAAATRHDCKVYPRPLRCSSLLNSPYNFTQDEVLGALARMKLEQEYEDIDTVTASNGKVCLYSTAHMSKKYARALCEYIEVEQSQNP